jgi:hypothetical protein
MRKPNALLLAALGLLALLYPLALVGAVLTIGYWIVRRSPNWHRNLFAFAGAGVGVLMGGYIPIWSAADTAASLVGQALAGGLYALGIQRSGILDPPATLPAQPTAEGPAPDRRDHPGAGQSARTEANGDRRYLELGRHAGSVVRVELREEGTFHISVLGEPGSGKTTTLVRIAHDYLAAGRPLVIVDGKGSGSLREAAEGLAEMHGIPFRLLDPHDPRTLGYNPATGSSADVTNKLVGAFRFSADAEVYRQVSQRVLPLLVKALREADSPVTVRRLAKALDPRVLGGDHIKERGGEAGRQLAALDTSRNNLIPVSLVGMQSRLYALLEGHYGELFDPREGREDLDVNAALGSGVTYVALSTLAASEDTELMARVLAQDFKQATAARLRRMRSEGHPPRSPCSPSTSSRPTRRPSSSGTCSSRPGSRGSRSRSPASYSRRAARSGRRCSLRASWSATRWDRRTRAGWPPRSASARPSASPAAPTRTPTRQGACIRSAALRTAPTAGSR